MAGYSNLIELLLADDYSVVAALHVVADVCEVEPLAKALLLIFSAEGKELQAAARLVKQEFALHQHHPAQILRQQSLASRVLGEHARASGRGFLEAALGPELRRLVGSTSSYDLEVDPSRLESDASSTHRLDENVRRLQQWGDAFVLALTSEGARDALPSSMRALAATIRAASAAHGLTPEQTTALVGGYLILRVVNPAIVTPEAHGLLDAPPPPALRRALVLVSKLVQNAANGVEFGAKEAYMKPFNAWVVRTAPRVSAFLAAVAAVEPAATETAAARGRLSALSLEAGKPVLEFHEWRASVHALHAVEEPAREVHRVLYRRASQLYPLLGGALTADGGDVARSTSARLQAELDALGPPPSKGSSGAGGSGAGGVGGGAHTAEAAAGGGRVGRVARRVLSFDSARNLRKNAPATTAPAANAASAPGGGVSSGSSVRRQIRQTLSFDRLRRRPPPPASATTAPMARPPPAVPATPAPAPAPAPAASAAAPTPAPTADGGRRRRISWSRRKPGS